LTIRNKLKQMKNYLPFLLMTAMLSFSSCGSDKKDEAEAFLNELDEGIDTPAISEETINDILMQVPAPLEISMLMKESGSQLRYLRNRSYLHKYFWSKSRRVGLYEIGKRVS